MERSAKGAESGSVSVPGRKPAHQGVERHGAWWNRLVAGPAPPCLRASLAPAERAFDPANAHDIARGLESVGNARTGCSPRMADCRAVFPGRGKPGHSVLD